VKEKKGDTERRTEKDSKRKRDIHTSRERKGREIEKKEKVDELKKIVQSFAPILPAAENATRFKVAAPCVDILFF
jgi:hypothetical protein